MSANYRDLVVWQKGLDLVTNVYQDTGPFPREEMFGLTSQMRRAAVSVPSNIAEGQGRLTKGEFQQFLGTSRGSLYELETQIEIAARLKFLPRERAEVLLERSEEVSRMLNGLIASIRNSKLETGNYYQVELLGLDVFDPIDMTTDQRAGNDVPCWLLDTDYNALCFHVCQAFFPRTAAWDDLKRSLKGEFDDAVWDHLSGTTSAPFEPGEHGQVAVRVIDDRGNELLVVKALSDPQKQGVNP